MIELVFDGRICKDTDSSCDCEDCELAREQGLGDPAYYILSIADFAADYCDTFEQVVPHVAEFPDGNTHVKVEITGPITEGDYMAVYNSNEYGTILEFDSGLSAYLRDYSKFKAALDAAFDDGDKLCVEITESD